MTPRPSISTPFSRIGQKQTFFRESIASLQGCCAKAGDAARDGRYSAAHDLFQNALVFFDRARGITWDDEGGVYPWQHAWQLSWARRELDKCAEVVYADTSRAGACERQFSERCAAG